MLIILRNRLFPLLTFESQDEPGLIASSNTKQDQVYKSNISLQTHDYCSITARLTTVTLVSVPRLISSH